MDTHISLPPELTAKIEREAKARGMSLPDFVCESLENAVAQKPSDDPLFSDTAVYRDDGPNDLASNHDDDLYGDASRGFVFVTQDVLSCARKQDGDSAPCRFDIGNSGNAC